MTEGTERIGRVVENAFGVGETVNLPKVLWDYFDWCVEEANLDMIEWVRNVDILRQSDQNFSDYLWGSLWEHQCIRYFHGYKSPPYAPPQGYADYLEYIDKREQCPERHKWEKRHLDFSDGVKETVQMQVKYWQFYDYLVEIGGTMSKWLQSAYKAHVETGEDLSDLMMKSLIANERKYYIEHGKYPLFISIKGYPRPLNVKLPPRKN
ncbi:MAG: hypothetical protein OIF58_08990 [Cohaesibacter sp.]|nr:hypothetical protein [Cohaesibacter sp.]